MDAAIGQDVSQYDKITANLVDTSAGSFREDERFWFWDYPFTNMDDYVKHFPNTAKTEDNRIGYLSEVFAAVVAKQTGTAMEPIAPVTIQKITYPNFTTRQTEQQDYWLYAYSTQEGIYFMEVSPFEYNGMYQYFPHVYYNSYERLGTDIALTCNRISSTSQWSGSISNPVIPERDHQILQYALPTFTNVADIAKITITLRNNDDSETVVVDNPEQIFTVELTNSPNYTEQSIVLTMKDGTEKTGALAMLPLLVTEETPAEYAFDP